MSGDRNLAGRRVVITGASSGIGAATAMAFAKAGARLVLGSRGKDGLDDVAQRASKLAAARSSVQLTALTQAQWPCSLPRRAICSVALTCGLAAKALVCLAGTKMSRSRITPVSSM